jgi:predicted acyltransferase (DUF342 family)
VGIGTESPSVSVDISYTDAIRIPHGTTVDRPVSVDDPEAKKQLHIGCIRYNTDNSQFEGFGPGSAWGSLGGVINVAQNTKILASFPDPDSTNNELMFITDGAERMRIYANGDISMNERIVVHNDASFNGNVYVKQTTATDGDVSMNRLLFVGGDASFSGNVYVKQTTTTDGDVSMNRRLFVGGDASFNGNVYVKQTTATDGDVSMNRRLFVVEDASFNGNVYVNGKTTNNGDVSMNGNLKVGEEVSATLFNATSDYRIKSNVQPLVNGVYVVDNLRPVSYTNRLSNKQDIGLIAHELQEHYPFLVNGEKDGPANQSVNYIGLIGLLIHEIQQLKTRISTLETRDA